VDSTTGRRLHTVRYNPDRFSRRDSNTSEDASGPTAAHAEGLSLGEIVTVSGDHEGRWRQVFEVLDEAIYGDADRQIERVRTLRPSVD
jgi:hypothetical protein